MESVNLTIHVADLKLMVTINIQGDRLVFLLTFFFFFLSEKNEN